LNNPQSELSLLKQPLLFKRGWSCRDSNPGPDWCSISKELHALFGNYGSPTFRGERIHPPPISLFQAADLPLCYAAKATERVGMISLIPETLARPTNTLADSGVAVLPLTGFGLSRQPRSVFPDCQTEFSGRSSRTLSAESPLVAVIDSLL